VNKTLRTAAVLAIVFACISSLTGLAWGVTKLTILHTNDTHGHLMPFSYPAIVQEGSDLEQISARHDIGGIARRASLVARIRADLTRQGAACWLIDAGDFCDGSAFSTEYHGDADVAAMNRTGYDLGTIGNHEFNNSLAQLKKLIASARYQIVCANATERESGDPLTTPYVIRQIGDARVGIFGLVTNEAGSYPAAKEGVAIANDVQTAREMVARLRGDEKADLVILISHCGKDADEGIARDAPGIDVIVGGHSHSRMPLGELIWRTDDLKVDEVNGTIIVQAFQWGGELGRLDLLLEKTAAGAWRVERYRERLIPITSDYADDPAVAAVVDSFWKPISARYGEVLGTAAADFSERGDDQAQYNLVADAVREAYHADIDFENEGGVRAPIIAGPITRATLAEVDPFQNTVVTFKMKGSEIRKLLLQRKPAVSGIRYRIFGGNLESVTMADGRSLDDGHAYACATNSYFAGRALGGFEITDRQDTGKNRFDVILESIKKAGTVAPAYDGRRVVIEAR